MVSVAARALSWVGRVSVGQLEEGSPPGEMRLWMVSGKRWPASHGSPQLAMLGHRGLLKNLQDRR